MRRLILPAILFAILPACLDSGSTGPQVAACDPLLTSFMPLEEADTVTLESGVSYIEMKEGNGETASAGSYVQLNYTLYGDGEPPALESSCNRFLIEMIVGGNNNLLSAFQAGVPGLREGGVRRVIIPAELGYTNPQHDLFDVELVFDLHAVTVQN